MDVLAVLHELIHLDHFIIAHFETADHNWISTVAWHSEIILPTSLNKTNPFFANCMLREKDILPQGEKYASIWPLFYSF